MANSARARPPAARRTASTVRRNMEILRIVILILQSNLRVSVRRGTRSL